MIFALASQCFTGETLVSTETGLRPIEDIQVGDYVWSEDTETGEKSLKKVLTVIVSETDTVVHITTGENEITTTQNHPFYVEGKGWTAASELEEGDVLHTQEGVTTVVQGVEIEQLDEAVKVYNLEVEDGHTYYVTDERVLVHNDCGNDGGNEGYSSEQGVGNPVKVEGKGSTGRTIPNSLNEQMAMDQVQSNPLENAISLPFSMNDSRWPGSEGWVKMQVVVTDTIGKTIIHYVYNIITGAFDDFKFK